MGEFLSRATAAVLFAALLTGTALLLGGTTGRAQTAAAVTVLDLNRMPGVWYEIARYPNKRQKDCARDSVELIALDDKPRRLQLVESCTTAKGYSNQRNLTARAVGKSGDGRFKVITLWPRSFKYWVLALDPNNQWSLIGSPNRRTLWVYAKTPTLPADTLAQIEAVAAAQGFSAAKLTLTPQTKTTAAP